MRSEGFTLLEMLIVITIIMIILAVTIPLYNQMLKGRALRQADAIVRIAIAQARQYTSNYPGSEAYIYFWDDAAYTYAGIIQVYAYTNNYGVQPIQGATYPLPKFVNFSNTLGSIKAGQWLYINPEGYISSYNLQGYNNGFTPVSASAFDNGIFTNAPVGDIVLEATNQPYKMFLNLDVPSGKVRKSVLWNSNP